MSYNNNIMMWIKSRLWGWGWKRVWPPDSLVNKAVR